MKVYYDDRTITTEAIMETVFKAFKVLMTLGFVFLGVWIGRDFQPKGLWFPAVTMIFLSDFVSYHVIPLTEKFTTNDHNVSDVIAIGVFIIGSLIAIIFSWLGFFFAPLLANIIVVGIVITITFVGWIVGLLKGI